MLKESGYEHRKNSDGNYKRLEVTEGNTILHKPTSEPDGFNLQENSEKLKKLNDIKNKIAEKMIEIKTRELSQRLGQESLVLKEAHFWSQDGREISVPKDHPLMPILRYAQSVLNISPEVGSPDTLSTDMNTGYEIESSLRKIFNPIYVGGEEEFQNAQEEFPRGVQDLVDCIKEYSREKYENLKVGKAFFHFVCNTGDYIKRRSLEDILNQFENDITS